jgi:hypothetical protein
MDRLDDLIWRRKEAVDKVRAGHRSDLVLRSPLELGPDAGDTGLAEGRCSARFIFARLEPRIESAMLFPLRRIAGILKIVPTCTSP